MTINSDASTAPAPATGLIQSRVTSPQTSMGQKTSSKSIDAITRRNEATKVELGEQSAKLLSSQEKSVEHLNGLDAQLAEAIKTLNDSLSRTPTKANISHDDVLNRFIVRIADKESGILFAKYLAKIYLTLRDISRGLKEFCSIKRFKRLCRKIVFPPFISHYSCFLHIIRHASCFECSLIWQVYEVSVRHYSRLVLSVYLFRWANAVLLHSLWRAEI